MQEDWDEKIPEDIREKLRKAKEGIDDAKFPIDIDVTGVEKEKRRDIHNFIKSFENLCANTFDEAEKKFIRITEKSGQSKTGIINVILN